PDRVTIPLSRFSTLTCSPGERNIVDPAAGPCHFAQVSGRTVHILFRGNWPLSISSNATSVVIILAMDAGGMRMSGFFAYRIPPEFTSSRNAVLAGVSNCGAAAGALVARRTEAAVARRTMRGMEMKASPIQEVEPNSLSLRNRVRQNSDGNRIEI